MNARRPGRRARWFLGALGALVAFVAVTNARGGADSFGWTALNDLTQFTVAAVAGAAGIWVGRGAVGRERTAWTLLGVGTTLWAVGQGLWTWYEVVEQVEVPSPGWCDAFFLAGPPLWIFGLVCFVDSPAGFRSQLRAWVEAAMLAGGLFLPAWLTALGPVSRAAVGTIDEQLVNLSYPVMDLVTISFILYALTRRRVQRFGNVAVVGAGVAAICVADVGFWYQNSIGDYPGASITDNGWLVGFFLFAVGSVWRPRAQQDGSGAFVSGHWWVAIPNAVVALGLAASVAFLASHRGEITAWETATLVALVFVSGAHASVVLSELHQLTRGLERTTSDLRASEEYFAALVKSSSDVVTVIDADMTVRWISDAAESVYGIDHRVLTGRPLHEAGPFAALADAVTNGVDRHEWALVDGAGRTRWAESTLTDLRDVPEVRSLVVNTRDVTERVQLTTQLRHQAFHDPLTAMPNRALFYDRVSQAVARQSSEASTVAVVLIDLDGFKNVNDSHGHHAGDEVLRSVARSLREQLDPRHTVARLGGDEFAILLDGLDGRDAATPLIESIVDALQTTVELGDANCETRGSVGVAFCGPGDGATVEQLVRDADIAMYRSKQRRHGGATAFTPDMHHAAQDRFLIEHELRTAIDAGQLVLHYQPTYALADCRIEGFEALVRWEHPTRGLVPPVEFIGIAEECGLIVPLGEWVVRTAVAQLRTWSRTFGDDGTLTMAVNLSVGQLSSGEATDRLIGIVAEADLDPSRIVFEITESMLISDVTTAVRRLERIATSGIRIAIDDFGTGYASLSNLQHLPLHLLKIDRQFVHGCDGDEAGRLVASILGIGHAFGLTTVAEGIENPAEFEALRNLGCDLAQGYYLSRPLAADAVHRLLERQYRCSRSGLPTTPVDATARDGTALDSIVGSAGADHRGGHAREAPATRAAVDRSRARARSGLVPALSDDDGGP